MRPFRRSLRESALTLARAFRRPGVYLLAVASLVLWALAYQVKQPYIVDVANMAYHPYIRGFNAIETRPDDPIDRYRWSTGSPTVFIPGVGNQPVVVTLTTIGARPGGAPPAVEIDARGQHFTVQTAAEQRADSFVLERGDPFDGDIQLRMSVPAFTPPGDPRELGVIIRRVEIAPAGYGLRPVNVPSLPTLGGLLAGVAILYALLVVTLRRSRFALAAGGAASALAALGIAVARPDTAFLAGQLPSLGLWTLALALPGRAALDVALNSDAQRGYRAAAAAGSLAFALAFAARFGGLTYAQFLTSDLVLHIHNVQGVLHGNLVFTEPLPDGTEVPYPPAYYMFVGALSWLFGQSEETLGLLLKWTASVLDASACLALAWVGTRLWSAGSGALAAVALAASPAAYDLFSAGNYTNIFAQSTLNLTLVLAAAYLGTNGGTWRWAPLLLALGFGLTMLGHYGMMLAALPILALFLLWALATRLRGRDIRRVLVVLGAGGAALVASIALYYWQLADLIVNQWGSVFSRLLGGRPEAGPRAGLGESLTRLPGKVGDLMTWPLAISGIGGLVGSREARGGLSALLGAWLAASFVFAVLDQVVGDAIRWYYMAAAPLALTAGLFLARLTVRRGSGRLLALLVLAAISWQAITFWINLIYTRYH